MRTIIGKETCLGRRLGGLPKLAALAASMVTIFVLLGTASTFSKRAEAVSHLVAFNGLASGTVLANQFPGVAFKSSSSGAHAVVESTPWGSVARMNACDGCEFFIPGVGGTFTDKVSQVDFHVGLLPTRPPSQAKIVVRVFDAQGGVLGSGTALVAAAAGFTTRLSVHSVSSRPDIASFEVTGDVGDTNKPIAMLDMTFGDLGTGSPGQPDFSITVARGVTLLAHGPAVMVPVVVTRYNGSSGPLHFSVSDIPPGLNASITATSSTGATLSLVDQGVTLPSFTLTITASPSAAAAGFMQRTASLFVKVGHNLTLAAPARIDISPCRVSVPIQIVRDASFSPGPVRLRLSTLPLNVTGSFSPITVPFSPASLAASTTLILVTYPGLTIPDTSVTISIDTADPALAASISTVIGGACSRQDMEFTMRGAWFCNNRGTITPIVGAQVEFFRYRSDWFDDRVDPFSAPPAFGYDPRTHPYITTDANGYFEANFKARLPGDYYPRLRLDDKTGVHLNKWYESSAWSTDGRHMSNRAPLLDWGNMVLEKDGGVGTPKCAIWQGVHNAYQDFVQTTGHVPPSSDITIVWQQMGETPWTYLATINWPDNYPTGSNYMVAFHEFGHTVRHTLDGDFAFLLAQAIQYGYLRTHWACLLSNDGFAFNEGWAEFWSHDTGAICEDGSMAREGNVANDLERLSRCPGVGRAGMVAVLAQGRNIVHSDHDFRERFKQLYGSSCPALTSVLKTSYAPSSAGDGDPRPTDHELAQLRGEIKGLDQAAAEFRVKASAPGASPLESVILMGRSEEALLLKEQFAARLKIADGARRGKIAEIYGKDYQQLASRSDYSDRDRQILMRVMDKLDGLLAQGRSGLNSDDVAARREQLAVTRVALQSGRIAPSDLSLLRPPSTVDGEGLAPASAGQNSVKASFLSIGLLYAAVPIVVVIAGLVYWQRRTRRPSRSPGTPQT